MSDRITMQTEEVEIREGDSISRVEVELRRAVDKIPTEYRDTAKLLCYSSAFGAARLSFLWSRPETVAECEKRMARAEAQKGIRRTNELVELMSLASKYDNDPEWNEWLNTKRMTTTR